MRDLAGSDTLIEAVSSSDRNAALEALKGMDPLEAHMALYPVAQTVLNPPYPNPHLPKMHAAIRELIPYLETGDIPSLIALETSEYARRPKTELPPKKEGKGTMEDFWERVRSGDGAGATSALAAEWRRDYQRTTAALVASGGGHLDTTLGHSVSCTSLILREANMQDDTWPALARIAYYHVEADLREGKSLPAAALRREELASHLLRATLGSSIVELHDTITLWGAERSRGVLSPSERDGLVAQWVDYVGVKEGEPYVAGKAEAPRSYEDFKEISASEAGPVVDALIPLAATVEGRKRMGRYLIKWVCDNYSGSCDPHHINGLASALWVTENFPDRPDVVAAALHQYLDYYL